MNDVEVQQLISKTRQFVDEMLIRCTTKSAPYVPDYGKFNHELMTYLQPLSEFCDSEFHAGRRDAMELMAQALREIAILRCDISKKLSRQQKIMGVEHPISIKLLQQLKLLIFFFEAPRDGGANPFEQYYLEYRFEIENDAAQKEKLQAKLDEIFSNTSTADYVRAKLSMDAENYQEALDFIKVGLEKCRENTPLYELQQQAYLKLANSSVAKGLEVEPRDTTLLNLKEFGNRLEHIRSNLKNGSISIDEFFEDIANQTSKSTKDVDLSKYSTRLSGDLTGFNDCSETVRSFLCTAEFLIKKLPQTFDQAPIAVECCKAVELTLSEFVFQPFKQSSASLDTQPSKEEMQLSKFVRGQKKLTLGEMAFTMKKASPNEQLVGKHYFEQFRDFIQAKFNLLIYCNLRTHISTENVTRYRNGAAHTSIYNQSDALGTRKWAHEAISLTVELLNRTSK